MNFDFLYQVNDGIATLTLNRPEVMNALTFEIYAQLRDLFEALRYDETVRAVVLTGAGDNFCSGGDVHEVVEAREGEVIGSWGRKTRERCRLRRSDRPIAVAAAGVVVGRADELRGGAVVGDTHRLALRAGWADHERLPATVCPNAGLAGPIAAWQQEVGVEGSGRRRGCQARRRAHTERAQHHRHRGT